MQEELLQIYDESGNPTTALPRSVAHAKPIKEWHGVVNIWLVNEKAELLVSKRSETVSHQKGKWQTYFGGHIPWGLTHKETAVKELEEEIGLKIKPEDLHFIDAGKFANEDHLHFYESYAYIFLSPLNSLNFTDGEISETKWMSMEDYSEESQNHPEQWCSGCSPDNQKRIRALFNNPN